MSENRKIKEQTVKEAASTAQPIMREGVVATQQAGTEEPAMQQQTKGVAMMQQLTGTAAPAMQPQIGTAPYIIQSHSKKEDTRETKRMKENFPFFGLGTLLYAVFYAFCMFQNGSGITFPFFIAASLCFLYFTLAKLELTLKKGSAFYMVSMMLLAVSTFCTDDWRIINLNKTGIFLLMMSLLLNQFFDTSRWQLGKYLTSICKMLCMFFGEIERPFLDGTAYYKAKGMKNKKLWYGVLGGIVSIPMLLIVAALLGGADALFRNMLNQLFDFVKPGNIVNIVFRITCIFWGSYMLTAYLCKRSIKEEVADQRKGEPVLAITITGLLSILYILFSGIQIFGLFLGKMQLPQGYTYAMYAREGFFQLLTVSILNLIIVLCGMNYFKESKLLKVILTIMSLCTFIMIVSSAMRMIIYIRYYYLTFLRIFVLWALVVLFCLFIGVIISIYNHRFPLFRYCVATVTILYLVLSFSHPDYIIAKVNVANAPREGQVERELKEDLGYGEEFFGGSFFLGEYYDDYSYLSSLSADASGILLPYMEELGYDIGIYKQEAFMEYRDGAEKRIWRKDGFGYHYLKHINGRLNKFSWRTFNISRYMTVLKLEKYSESTNY
ncbi:MAG: DUF4173 domain-containing protein [Lachnospiraceae bacterium]|nr:DUF4173 domain-containing protein [Lachnospiraceae bacterium]